MKAEWVQATAKDVDNAIAGVRADLDATHSELMQRFDSINRQLAETRRHITDAHREMERQREIIAITFVTCAASILIGLLVLMVFA